VPEDAGVHELGGFPAKDLLVTEFAVLEVGDHEIAHVARRRVETLPAGKASTNSNGWAFSDALR